MLKKEMILTHHHWMTYGLETTLFGVVPLSHRALRWTP